MRVEIEKQKWNTKEEKPRLFVDMDGTLAEWRNISIHIDSSEEASGADIREKLKALDNILYMKGYFQTLQPHKNVVEAVRGLIKEGNTEVFILSCVKPDREDSSPRQEKNAWLDTYLPEVDTRHRLFVPDGENKVDYVPGGTKENDYLLDDYSKNLMEWEAGCGKNRAIKLLNNVNESKGEWRGNSVSYDHQPKQIAESIKKIIHDSLVVIHQSPLKNRNTTPGHEFVRMFKTTSVLNRVAVIKDNEDIPNRLRTRIMDEGWDCKALEKGYRLYFGSREDLVKELEDMSAMRTQGVIPEEILESVERIAYEPEEERGEYAAL